MIDKPTTTRWRRFQADLTGASDRWGRTIVYGLLFARLSLAPALLVVALLFLWTTDDALSNDALAGFSGRLDNIDGARIFSAVVFAPLTESLLVVFLVWLMGKKFGWSGWLVALLSAVIFVPLHGLAIGSLMIAPFFGLMALVQFNWMQRGDALGGYWVVVSMHAVVNISSLLTTTALRASGT